MIVVVVLVDVVVALVLVVVVVVVLLLKGKSTVKLSLAGERRCLGDHCTVFIFS